ncbi:MAG: efflux RND transporter periplasmic adaptor subunit [Bacteroidota bacterium]
MKYLIYLSAFFALAACTENKSSKQEEHDHHDEHELVLTKTQMQANNYNIGAPELRSFERNINFTGLVDLPPSHRHVISHFLPGYIKQVKVIVGDHVKKGETLAVIEHQGILELQERYAVAESELEFLEQEYNRLKQLHEENVVAKKDFIEAKSAFLSKQATRNSLKKQLQLIHISPSAVLAGKMSSTYAVLAPADGIISSVNIATGTWVGDEKQLMALVDPDHIHLELQVFAKDIPTLSEGQSLKFGLHGESEHNYSATIYRIGAEVKEDRRVMVHAHPDTILDKLTIGAYVNGKINVADDSLIALPTTAVTAIDDENFVLLAKDEQDGETHFKRTKVKVIQRQSGWIAIDKKWKDHSFLLNGAFDLIKDEEAGFNGHSH